jgi:hypothetical protein
MQEYRTIGAPTSRDNSGGLCCRYAAAESAASPNQLVEQASSCLKQSQHRAAGRANQQPTCDPRASATHLTTAAKQSKEAWLFCSNRGSFDPRENVPPRVQGIVVLPFHFPNLYREPSGFHHQSSNNVYKLLSAVLFTSFLWPPMRHCHSLSTLSCVSEPRVG